MHRESSQRRKRVSLSAVGILFDFVVNAFQIMHTRYFFQLTNVNGEGLSSSLHSLLSNRRKTSLCLMYALSFREVAARASRQGWRNSVRSQELKRLSSYDEYQTILMSPRFPSLGRSRRATFPFPRAPLVARSFARSLERERERSEESTSRRAVLPASSSPSVAIMRTSVCR